jgi:L-ascorbate metabolism protein UlaG (beta-lactamase superfamily)
MIITYSKPGYFRLQSGMVSIDIDPVSGRTKADVVLRTALNHGDENALRAAGEVAAAGEYEIKDIEIRGFQEVNESMAERICTVYLVSWEDLKFAILGQLSQAPESAIMKEISEVDVLFLPTGDAASMPAEVAAKLVRQIEPSVVIPCYFKNWQDFARELGQQKVTPQEKYVFKKKELVAKEGKLVVLEG